MISTVLSSADDWFVSSRRAVLVADMVESVRLIEEDPVGTITLWRDLVGYTEQTLLASGGRKVKSLGDGMLLDLDTVADALRIAFGIAERLALLNQDRPDDLQVQVRTGLEVGDLMVDGYDVYGPSVNRAARLGGIGSPGDIIGSAAVRDQITDGVDASVEDLGECFLKHIRNPVRAYRLTPPGVRHRIIQKADVQPLLPTLAVIPFAGPLGQPSGGLGQVLAEELIRAFGQSPELNVITRLSTAPFAREPHDLRTVAEHLSASHVLTGTVAENGDKLRLSMELTEIRSNQVVWADRFEEKAAYVLIGDQALISRIAEAVGRAIVYRELQRARALPVRTLESYTLMLAAINAMYRLSQSDFLRAKDMLETAVERNPRHSVPLAWMGQWYVLKAQQGWTGEPDRDGEKATALTSRALDLNPDCEHALTFGGSVKAHLTYDMEAAEQHYDLALARNPNNAMANLLLSTVHAFQGRGDSAAYFAERAQLRSPFDPHKYMYDCLTSLAYFSAGDFQKALNFAKYSLKANSVHLSTIRHLAMAQWELGDEEAARETVRILTALDPEFTISKWRRSNPAAHAKIGDRVGDILRAAGAPL